VKATGATRIGLVGTELTRGAHSIPSFRLLTRRTAGTSPRPDTRSHRASRNTGTTITASIPSDSRSPRN
jgi:hypothetical protein